MKALIVAFLASLFSSDKISELFYLASLVFDS